MTQRLPLTFGFSTETRKTERKRSRHVRQSHASRKSDSKYAAQVLVLTRNTQTRRHGKPGLSTAKDNAAKCRLILLYLTKRQINEIQNNIKSLNYLQKKQYIQMNALSKL